MFYGEYQHTIDRKGRIILPAKFREAAKSNFIEKFFVTRGLDKCLFMFAEDEWKNQEQKFKSMPFTKQEARRFNRMYFSGAQELIPDKQGRILIPDYLRNYAGLGKQAVVTGLMSRMEIWDEESWKQYKAKTESASDEIAEKMGELGI